MLHFFKLPSIGENLLEVCTRLLFCFDIVGNISIQLPLPFSKTGRLGKSPRILLTFSAKQLLYQYF